jgi:tetratricopeptide (TPR) repeat protein
MARSAHREAVACFEQALAALSHLPENRQTREQAIDLRFALRTALFPSGDYPHILAYLREAERLAEGLDDAPRLARVSLHMLVHFAILADYDQAIVCGQRGLALATSSGEVDLQAVLNTHLAIPYHAQGAYDQAIQACWRTMELLGETRLYDRLGMVFLPAVWALQRLTMCLTEQGRFTEASASVAHGCQIAEAAGLPPSRMSAKWGSGVLALSQGDVPRAITVLEQALAMCREFNLPVFAPWIGGSLGVAYTRAGRLPEAMALCEQAIQQGEALGIRHDEAQRLALAW